MTRFVPADINELRDAIGEALAAGEPLELVAGGSKRGLGRPMQTPHVLDLSRLSGIREYEPSELVLTAGAATPLAAIERALAAHGQMLAFEPPDWRRLLGGPGESAGEPTLGGALACNLGGPRRVKSGAARDHFLGFRGVSGRGEIFKAGGKVVKNVTGYDLCKLLAGSYGTLAALEEVSVKVLPCPETVATLLFEGVAPVAAVRLMSAALGSPHDISGAASLPISAVIPPSLKLRGGAVALRVEGPAPSVAYRCDALLAEHRGAGEAHVVGDADSAALWRAVGDAARLAGLGDHAIWRLSVVPSRAADIAESIARDAEGDVLWYADWGGGLIWAAIAGMPDGGARAVRGAIAAVGQAGSTGHATLIRAPAALRAAVPVFEPQPPALAALSRRVKEAFDPQRILNPGRMVEGS